MSFHDLSLHLHAASEVKTPAPSAPMSKIERDVIDMARSDCRWSLNPDGVLQRGIGLLFGIRAAPPLANERLEQLRRFAVTAWSRDSIRARDLRQLFDVGFSSNDAWRILAHIGERRGGIPEVEAWPA
jgi:hypothetical protein